MHKRHMLKIIGLSLLTAVGVMVIGASAAQAKWLLLVNKTSVKSIKLNATVPKGQLLVPSLGLAITCEGGTASLEGTLSNEDQTLTGSAVGTATGCDDANFGEVCDVRSTGQAAGTIVGSGTGTGGMGAGEEEYFVDASSENFTKIEYIGEECPLTEIDGTVNGSARIVLLNALEDTKLKVAHLKFGALFFGEEEAAVHDGNEEPILVSLTEVGGNTWGVHLVGL